MMKTRAIRLLVLATGCCGIVAAGAGREGQGQAAATASRATQSAATGLLEKAHAEEARGRVDLAIQTWQQVLLAEPNNVEALGSLARALRVKGDAKLADTYLQRLRVVSPKDAAAAEKGAGTPAAASPPASAATAKPEAGAAKEPADTAVVHKAELVQAARLTDLGKYAEAMAIYRKVFGTRPPAGDWALAYYETEAGTESGRPHAVEGLRGLVDKYPGQARYQIALGRVLTYDPATREEGRHYLAAYPKDVEAAKALRQSLLWDAANPAVAGEIRSYLASHDDAQLAAVFKATQPAAAGSTAGQPAIAVPAATGSTPVASPRAPVAIASAPPQGKPGLAMPAAPAVAAVTPPEKKAITPVAAPSSAAPQRVRAEDDVEAYRALNANRIDEAERRFKAILAVDAADVKAQAGMGYVRMQQGNFPGAISFLEQARQKSPDDKDLLAALDTARFWFIMGEGKSAFAANDLTSAEKRYRTALELRPESAEALEGLGGTLVRAQQPRAAVALFEHAVRVQPASVEGWKGLFAARLQSGEAGSALAEMSAMPAEVRTQLMQDPLFLQSEASAYDRTGSGDEARATLESALTRPFAAGQAAVKADIAMQLAGLLASSNHLDRAGEIYRQIVAEDSTTTAAWQGLVRAQHAMGHDADADATVHLMPAATYDAAMRDAGFEITVASVYQAEKKLDAAQELLQKAVNAETQAGQKPTIAVEMQIAGIYLDQGRPQQAYPVYQQVLRERPDDVDAWAGLLSALHVTGHDKEAIEQVKLVPPGVRAQLESRAGYLQMMAAVSAAVGQTDEPVSPVGKVEQSHTMPPSAAPLDVEIQNAWLSYKALDDGALYRQLMALGARQDLSAEQRRTVETIWTSWAARRAGEAEAQGDAGRSLAILNAAARAFPDNPAAIKMLAIGYAQAGEPHQAVMIYKAQNMASASAEDYAAAVGAAMGDGDLKDAEIWLRYALAKYPADAQILILAARFEQARGDTAKAINYYRASLKALPPVKPASKLAADLGLAASTSPSSLPSAEQPQDLSILLAPGPRDSAPAEPYLPSYGKPGTVAPYDGGASKVLPPIADPNAGGAAIATAAVAPANGYKPYVAYVAPPVSAPAPERVSTGTAVAVQLGHAAPPPPPPQADMTDVLPTVRYGPSARANQAEASRAEVAAARADRIRRLQQQSAGVTTGQSHPPPEETITAEMQDAQYAPRGQIGQPSIAPGRGVGSVPDTGAQQYPQPRTPPQGATVQPRRTITRKTPTTQAVSAPATGANNVVPQPAATPVAPLSTAPVSAAPAPTLSPAAGGPPPAVGPAYPLAPPPSDADLRAHNVPPLGGIYMAQAPIAVSPRQQAESELASLEGSYSGWVGGTGIARYRSGSAGLDRLYDMESPVEASAVAGRAARLTVVAQPVFLNSGVWNGGAFAVGNVPYLGTLAGNSATVPAQQFSNGIGGELQLSAKRIGLAVGYTPYEFLVRNVTGRFFLSGPRGHITLYGERQPVKDTQLSYAGLNDPGTATAFGPGGVWGGVVSTGGGVRLSLGVGASSFSISGDGGVLTGQHVLDNYRYGGNAEARFRVKDWAGRGSLSVGAAIDAMHYDHDEAGLSYGQGGYFSPDWYYAASVPVALHGRDGAAFHYAVDASVGVETFRQAQAAFYPLDPALQASFVPSNGAVCTGSQLLTYNCGVYPATVSTLLQYSVRAETSYRFAEHWYGGGFVLAGNKNNYEDVSGGFFFRYVFRAQRSPDGYPAGMFRVDGLRPLQIP